MKDKARFEVSEKSKGLIRDLIHIYKADKPLEMPERLVVDKKVEKFLRDNKHVGDNVNHIRANLFKRRITGDAIIAIRIEEIRDTGTTTSSFSFRESQINN